MLGKTKWIVAGVLVFVLLVAGIGGAVVFAQSPTPTPTGAKTWADLYWQTLAQKLGTTVEKLQQAMTDARKDALNQAVKEGMLTQAQADAMLQRQQNVAPGVPFGNLGPRGGSLNNAHTIIANAELSAAAKTLGMSTTDLTTALRTKTLLDLAREKNVDAAKLRTAIADAEKAALDQAVKDGALRVTQAQVDALKANIKPENIDLNRRGMGVAPRGGFGGFDRFGGWGRQAPGRSGKR